MSSPATLVIERALAGAELLPPARRADLYDGVCFVLSAMGAPCEKVLAARACANALREAETLQRTFEQLLQAEPHRV